MNKKVRIVEIIDSNGISIFYPERKVFGLWWWKWVSTCSGPDPDFISFNSLKGTSKWLTYKRVFNVLTHEVQTYE